MQWGTIAEASVGELQYDSSQFASEREKKEFKKAKTGQTLQGKVELSL